MKTPKRYFKKRQYNKSDREYMTPIQKAYIARIQKSQEDTNRELFRDGYGDRLPPGPM